MMDKNIADFMGEIIALRDEGKEDAAVKCAKEMLERFPFDYGVHMFASSMYGKMGKPLESMTEAAIALAIAPKVSVTYHFLAKKLTTLGMSVLAERVLENGWEIARKELGIRQSRNPEEKVKYFTIPESSSAQPA